MKKMFFIILAIIIVILVFSLGSFGVEADAVMSGYESTRRYAQNSKMMTVAVDTYKEIVKVKADDEERRENAVPDEVPTLGSYGTLLSDEDYEKYTDGLYFSATAKYCESDSTLSEDKAIAAKMHTKTEWSSGTDIVNYLTTDNTGSGTQLHLYSAWQCAAFADAYTNQISYDDTIVVTGAAYQSSALLNNYTDTCWSSSTGVTLNSVDDAKSFFKDVTPGTFVRTSVGDGHSYIVLGADDENIIFYDANSHGDCGIQLHKAPWSSFVDNYKTAWATKITTIISPPGTQLPQGCQDKFGAVGTIVNAKEDSQ